MLSFDRKQFYQLIACPCIAFACPVVPAASRLPLSSHLSHELIIHLSFFLPFFFFLSLQPHVMYRCTAMPYTYALFCNSTIRKLPIATWHYDSVHTYEVKQWRIIWLLLMEFCALSCTCRGKLAWFVHTMHCIFITEEYTDQSAAAKSTCKMAKEKAGHCYVRPVGGETVQCKAKPKPRQGWLAGRRINRSIAMLPCAFPPLLCRGTHRQPQIYYRDSACLIGVGASKRQAYYELCSHIDYSIPLTAWRVSVPSSIFK